jgi:hypothetical protein
VLVHDGFLARPVHHTQHSGKVVLEFDRVVRWNRRKARDAAIAHRGA